MARGLRPPSWVGSAGEGGFGLVGLIVSMVILAGLAVLAVVTFGSTLSSVPTSIGSRGATGTTGTGKGASPTGIGGLVNGAADEVAQQNLSGALDAADQVALGTGNGYGALDPSALGASTHGLQFVAGSSSGPDVISVATSTAGGAVTMAVRSASGTCWLAWRSSSTTLYGRETVATCAATALASPPAPGAGPGGATWEPGAFP